MGILLNRKSFYTPGTEVEKWTVLGVSFRIRTSFSSREVCVVQCECGSVAVASVCHLKKGLSTNCGCVRKITLPASKTTHGASKSRLYRVWKGMRERCYYKSHKDYHQYGGLGVTVCDEWLGDFSAFRDWAFSQGWVGGLHIDRIDPWGNYTPDNCRVTTPKENANNKRRHKTVVAWGEEKTIWQWSKDPRCKVSDVVIRGRIDQGWTAEEAMTRPLFGSRRNRRNL